MSGTAKISEPEQNLEQALDDDSSLLVGGPNLDDSAVENEALERAEERGDEVVERQVAPKTPLYRGLKGDFFTQGELSEYVRKCEAELLELQARQAGFSDAIRAGGKASDAVSSDEAHTPLDPSKVAEEFFADPAGALTKLREDVKREILGEVRRETTHNTFWESFYVENPELRGAEDIVDLTLEKHRREWANVPVSQAKKLLADQVRLRLDALRGAGNSLTTRALQDSRVTALRGAPARSEGVPVKQVSRKPMTLVDAIRDVRAKRRGRIAG